MKRLLAAIWLGVASYAGFAQWTEPQGGVYPTNLIFFDDAVRGSTRIEAWGSGWAVDNVMKQTGNAGLRVNIQQPVSGMHILWGSWVNDTTVFWVHDASHISFWARPSGGRTRISVALGFMEGQYVVMPPTVIGDAGEWRRFDLVVPAQAVRQPLNDLKFVFEKVDAGATIHFDDIKISNVRLYAGKGTPPSISGIYADQIGYDTYGIKTFSAEKHSSFQIVRVGDNAQVFTGTDSRAVASKVIGDRTAFIGDFTALQARGKYKIRLDNGKESLPFDIGPNVYDATLRAALRFFYYQRNNTAITMPYAEGPWIHEKDDKEKTLLPDGKSTKIVRKGWHDAGDLAVYMPTMTYSCFWLLLAWEEFKPAADNFNIPESGDGIPDILNETRWGLEWILDMQDANDGGFHQNMCVQKDNPYRYGRTTPNNISGYELTNKTTPATASAVGTLAYAAKVFEDVKFDPPFARKMREAAVKGWKYLEDNAKHAGITQNCDNYQDPDDIHARFYAATGLFYATGEEKYHQYLLKNDPGSGWISDYNNQTNLAYLLYTKSPKCDQQKQTQLWNLLVARAYDATRDRLNHPFGFIGHYYWGSLATAFTRAGNYNLLDWKVNRDFESLNTTLQQIHYTFGQNSLGFVYMTGFGANGMRVPFHHWLKTLAATPFAFPGMLAGGPNENPDPADMRSPEGYKKPADTPIDQRYQDTHSWSTNEIAINQNANLVYVLAAAQAFAKSGINPAKEKEKVKGRKK